MIKYLYKMECLTNMHVGNGDVNYNIIDNEVQKDAVLTDVPVIHSSGVKGALKQHFKNQDYCETLINNIFGDEIEGQYKFFDAKLIARPLRVSSGDKPYLLATSNCILKEFSDFLAGLGMSDVFSYAKICIPKDTFIGTVNSSLEGCTVTPTPVNEKISNIIGGEYAITNSLSDFSLPVVARNVLEDGKSKNIWYEEIVPYKSVFCFVVMAPEATELIFEDGVPVQFGGNASIGQGYTKITELAHIEEVR